MKTVFIPASFVPSGPLADELAILAAELLWRTSLSDERKNGHYVPFGRRLGYRYFGGKYATVLREAEKVGLIERNHCYSATRFGKSVRLLAEHRTGQTKSYTLDRKRKPRTSIRIEQSDTVGRWMAEWFPHFTLDVNVDELSPWSKYAVRRFASGEHFATRCAYRRFHSTFTSLEKSLRRQIEFDGQRLVELDIKNCQPLILGINARESKHIWYGDASDDVGWFLELCVDGCLYEFLLEQCCLSGMSLYSLLTPYRRRGCRDRPLVRDDVKRAFIVLLFADNHVSEQSALFRIVQGAFPTVAHYMRSAKSVEYQNLARECQRTESLLVIDTAVDEIRRTCPDVPLFTVHDSVTTTEGHVDLVNDAISHAFLDKGVSPPIHINHF